MLEWQLHLIHFAVSETLVRILWGKSELDVSVIPADQLSSFMEFDGPAIVFTSELAAHRHWFVLFVLRLVLLFASDLLFPLHLLQLQEIGFLIAQYAMIV